jgi:hypothetical protein
MSQASASVMAITKMSIGVQPVNLFTVAARALRQCGLTSDGRWLEMDGEDDDREQKHRENT